MSKETKALYLSVDQVAERFSVSKHSIWRWRREGDFPAPYKLIGTTARWKLADIEEWEGGLRSGLATHLLFDLEEVFVT
ncbi:helix-turn-helix domain-containing protein [uncultured Maritimibacter sp.]|jgi:prophage regulatory protein|uniref:helix-turn-helix transcriptional regulator n=1 Tax=uncultured Maritimibacter sp. TaxID=991866 RepID=UPI002614C674|nr:helix-turn-helix domain-containing protein [uncultured Maritimibacter sp.]